MSLPSGTRTGGCLCGAVRYRTETAVSQVVNCHCGQCRRFHGHLGAYVNVRRDALTLEADRELAWYRSSDTARRGFCRSCGSSLFFDRIGGSHLSVAAGTLDDGSGLATVAHIYVADKGGYYEITDGLKQYPKSSKPG